MGHALPSVFLVPLDDITLDIDPADHDMCDALTFAANIVINRQVGHILTWRERIMLEFAGMVMQGGDTCVEQIYNFARTSTDPVAEQPVEEASNDWDVPADGVRQINVDWDVPAGALNQFAPNEALEEGANLPDGEAPADALTVPSGWGLSVHDPVPLLDVSDCM